MKTWAIRVERTGGPEVLKWTEIDLVPPARGEVRVRHAAVGLNFLDVYHRTGLYPLPLPFTPGIEAAGVVEALGPDVSDLAVGDRIAYASRPIGAYCVRRNMPADRVVKLPAHVALDVAAAVMLKGMSVHYLLRRTFKVERDHWILVHAAAGGLGSILVPWARSLGAHVIATVGSDEKAARVRALGAEHTIVYTRENFVERVAAITAGRGVHVAYDSVGKDTLLGSIECLAPRGMIVSYGQSSGSVPPLDLALLAKRSTFLTRPSLFDYTATRDELVAASNDVFDQIARGIVVNPIERRFELRDAESAHRELEGRKTSGSSVFTVTDGA